MSKPIDVETRTFLRFWLVIAGLLIAALFITKAMTGLLLVGFSAFLAIAINPLTNKINKLWKKDRRGLAAGLSVGIVFLVLGMFVVLVGPLIISETSKFLSTAPEQIQAAGGWQAVNDFGKSVGIDDIEGQVVSTLQGFAQEVAHNFSNIVVTSVSVAANILTSVVLVVVLTILFLAQGPGLLKDLWRILDTRNDKAMKVTKRIFERIAGVISKYINGQAIVAVIDGIVVGLIVFVLSLIFGFSSGSVFPMMMIAAILYLIPLFGPVISCILITLLLFFSSPISALIFFVLYVAYEQVANNVIAPKIQGNALNLPSLIILVAVTIGIYMFGLVGAIISIPVAGCIKVLIEEYPSIRAAKNN